ncbi:unnamed protein product, partial [Chrysoparadoxa australica]
RVFCLERALTAVSNTLTQVELIDSGVNDAAGAKLLSVLLERGHAITSLDLQDNSVGVLTMCAIATA